MTKFKANSKKVRISLTLCALDYNLDLHGRQVLVSFWKLKDKADTFCDAEMTKFKTDSKEVPISLTLCALDYNLDLPTWQVLVCEREETVIIILKLTCAHPWAI